MTQLQEIITANVSAAMSAPSAISNKRNFFGVKDNADQYRIINGEHFANWCICPSPEQMKAYRAAGIRYRHFDGALFIRACDNEKAEAIDAANDYQR